jgi:hypothetical protein
MPSTRPSLTWRTSRDRSQRRPSWSWDGSLAVDGGPGIARGRRCGSPRPRYTAPVLLGAAAWACGAQETRMLLPILRKIPWNDRGLSLLSVIVHA